MSKARPKLSIIYKIATFDGKAKCYINCNPQQRWEYSVKENKVTLDRKGVTLVIPKEDFYKDWEGG